MLEMLTRAVRNHTYTISRYFDSSPGTDFMAPTMYWTMIEAAVCIIAVCLPIFCGVSSVDILNSLRGALPLQSHSRQSSTCREPSFDERNRKDSKASECSTMFDQPYQGLSRFETTAEKGPSLRDRDDVPERGIVVCQTASCLCSQHLLTSASRWRRRYPGLFEGSESAMPNWSSFLAAVQTFERRRTQPTAESLTTRARASEKFQLPWKL